MFYLENNTTFSGADIKVFAYRSVSDFLLLKNKEDRKAKQNTTNPLYPNDPFADIDPRELDVKIAESLEGVASGRAQSVEQKTVITPDGKTTTVDATEAQRVENQYAAPEVRYLEQEAVVYYPNTQRYSEPMSVDEAQEEAFLILQDGGTTDIQTLPIKTEVTYADGRVEEMDIPATDEVLDNHIPAQISAAPAKTDYTAVQTNKVNPNYIDIVKQGSDKNALELARKYKLAKLNKNRNEILEKTGNTTGLLKPIIELGSLYSITYSSFREKHAVRTLGRVSAKDYTRGQRTIAGSMNFAVFQSHELMDFLKGGANEDNIVILDQLPKFNLMLIMVNEYGGASILHLFGVQISTESQQTSVEDLALMNNVTFYAEDIMTIENVGNIFETSLSMLHPTIIAGKTLQYYKGNQSTTLSGLLSINNDVSNNRIQGILSRSRGLF